jgi:hypothetical protein
MLGLLLFSAAGTVNRRADNKSTYCKTITLMVRIDHVFSFLAISLRLGCACHRYAGRVRAPVTCALRTHNGPSRDAGRIAVVPVDIQAGSAQRHGPAECYGGTWGGAGCDSESATGETRCSTSSPRRRRSARGAATAWWYSRTMPGSFTSARLMSPGRRAATS